jgi:hypothetical protein
MPKFNPLLPTSVGPPPGSRKHEAGAGVDTTGVASWNFRQLNMSSAAADSAASARYKGRMGVAQRSKSPVSKRWGPGRHF